jgi:uncharacterized membrane protein
MERISVEGVMSNLIVMTFDSSDEARQVREALRAVERDGRISLDDAAVIRKDADGDIKVDNEIDRGVKLGALGGGLLGLVLSFLFPVVGLVIGAAGGALVGRMVDLGIDQKFVQDVSESLQPNHSALFVIVRDADPTITISALEPFEGTLYHTTFDSTVEEELRNALR